MSENEVVGFGVGLLVAGFETVASELAHDVLVLLRRPEDNLTWTRAMALNSLTALPVSW